MKYKITIHFKDQHDEAYGADTYSHANGVLELFTYNDNETIIKLFPFTDIVSVDILQIGA